MSSRDSRTDGRHVPDSPKWNGRVRFSIWKIIQKTRMHRKSLLTIGNRDARIHSKLNRLIEARYSSVPSGKVVQPPKEKGITAEVWEICPGFSCWVVREHLPDCHKKSL